MDKLIPEEFSLGKIIETPQNGLEIILKDIQWHPLPWQRHLPLSQISPKPYPTCPWRLPGIQGQLQLLWEPVQNLSMVIWAMFLSLLIRGRALHCPCACNLEISSTVKIWLKKYVKFWSALQRLQRFGDFFSLLNEIFCAAWDTQNPSCP